MHIRAEENYMSTGSMGVIVENQTVEKFVICTTSNIGMKFNPKGSVVEVDE